MLTNNQGTYLGERAVNRQLRNVGQVDQEESKGSNAAVRSSAKSKRKEPRTVQTSLNQYFQRNYNTANNEGIQAKAVSQFVGFKTVKRLVPAERQYYRQVNSIDEMRRYYDEVIVPYNESTNPNKTNWINFWIRIQHAGDNDYTGAPFYYEFDPRRFTTFERFYQHIYDAFINDKPEYSEENDTIYIAQTYEAQKQQIEKTRQFTNAKAFFQYSKFDSACGLLQRLAMARLQNPDVPCGYESCVQIAANELKIQRFAGLVHRNKKIRRLALWKLFKQEEQYIQEAFLSGSVQDFLLLFNNKYETEIGCYDSHSKQYWYLPAAEYFLVYRFEHVIPLTKYAVRDFAKIMLRKSQKNVSQQSQPYIVKSKFQKLNQLIKDDDEKWGFEERCTNDIGDNQHQRDGAKKQYNSRCKATQYRLSNKFQLTSDEMDKAMQHRKNIFHKKWGMLHLDFETYTDNAYAERYGTGNQVPYLVWVIGTAMRQVDARGKDYSKRRLPIPVKECFITDVEYDEDMKAGKEIIRGKSCIDKFFDFIETNRLYNIEQPTQRKYNANNGKTETIRYFNTVDNVLIAHNGMKFDYRFMYEHMSERLGQLKMIGSVNQPKMFKASGLRLVDTCLVYPQKLTQLAKDFKIDIDKIDLDPVISREDFLSIAQDGKTAKHGYTLNQIKQYCKRDVEVLQKIAHQIYYTIYTEPFNNSLSRNDPFYHSSAGLTFDIFQRCYLEYDLPVYEQTLWMEVLSMMGGKTQAFLPFMNDEDLAICVDLKQAYPAAMKNQMPIYLKHPDNPFTVCGQYLTDVNQIIPYNLYQVSYKFPPHVKYPYIQARAVDGDGGIMDLLTNDDNLVPVWGYSIKKALEQGAEIYCNVYVEYEGIKIFEKYVDQLTELRQKAKEAGNDSISGYCKLLLNSLYGKFSQKAYPVQEIGTYRELMDMGTELFEQHKTRLDGDMIIKELVCVRQQLCVLQYQLENALQQQKGGLVRISSYITAITRANLVEGLNLIEQYVPGALIHYCDTDSITINLPHNNNKCQEYYVQIKQDIAATGFFPKDEGQKMASKSLSGKLLQYLENNKAWQRIQKIQRNDIRFIVDNPDVEQPSVNLVTAKTLGTFCLEKVIIAGMFLGAKEYYLDYFEVESDKFAIACKLKGVRINKPKVEANQEEIDEYLETRAKLERIGNKYKEGNEEWAFDLFKSKGFFRQCHTGINVEDNIKTIKPNLTKGILAFTYDLQTKRVTTQVYRPYPTYEEYTQAVEQRKKMNFKIKKNVTEYYQEEFSLQQQNMAVQGGSHFLMKKYEMQISAVNQEIFKNVSIRHERRLPHQLSASTLKYSPQLTRLYTFFNEMRVINPDLYLQECQWVKEREEELQNCYLKSVNNGKTGRLFLSNCRNNVTKEICLKYQHQALLLNEDEHSCFDLLKDDNNFDLDQDQLLQDILNTFIQPPEIERDDSFIIFSVFIEKFFQLNPDVTFYKRDKKMKKRQLKLQRKELQLNKMPTQMAQYLQDIKDFGIDNLRQELTKSQSSGQSKRSELRIVEIMRKVRDNPVYMVKQKLLQYNEMPVHTQLFLNEVVRFVNRDITEQQFVASLQHKLKTKNDQEEQKEMNIVETTEETMSVDTSLYVTGKRKRDYKNSNCQHCLKEMAQTNIKRHEKNCFKKPASD